MPGSSNVAIGPGPGASQRKPQYERKQKMLKGLHDRNGSDWLVDLEPRISFK